MKWIKRNSGGVQEGKNYAIGLIFHIGISTVDGMGARAPPGDILLISVFRLEILSRKLLAMASSRKNVPRGSFRAFSEKNPKCFSGKTKT